MPDTSTTMTMTRESLILNILVTIATAEKKDIGVADRAYTLNLLAEIADALDGRRDSSKPHRA